VQRTAEELKVLAGHGLAAWNRDSLRFIHGTSYRELAKFERGIDWRKGSSEEFGRGFYAFIGCGDHEEDGLARAVEWAELRAGKHRSQPILVEVTIDTQRFLNAKPLLMETSTYPIGDRHRDVKDERGVVIPIIWGPVYFEHDPVWEGQPLQYRFAAGAAEHLSVTSCYWP
jgi:hypothetical protein